MEIKMQKRRCAYYAFGINFVCAFFSLILFLILGKGILTLSNDFNAQELSFNIFANEAIKNGDIFWNWNIDLGSDFITTFSFYNLGSPFFWITLLFPASWFPYLMGWVYMLKYAVAGLTSYLYLSRFTERPAVSLCCSVLYAFSGFQCANLVFYHFHDVVALFPLLLIGLEIMMKENRKGVFAFAVFANALLNYFFFIGEVLFVILYYICRYLLPDWKNHMKKAFLCLWEGALGTCMAAVLFLPSCLAIMKNSRVSERLSGMDLLIFPWKDYLWNLRALFLPGDNMAVPSVLSDMNWYSVAAYLPMAGILLAVAYVMKNRKSWLSRLLIVSLVTAFVPVLNNAFVVFTVEPYRRWYYMPVLMLALASQQVIEKGENYPLKRSLFFCLAGVGVLTAGLLLMSKISGESLLRRPLIFGVQLGLAITGLFISYVILRQKKRYRIAYMTAGVMVFAVATTGLTLYTYRQNDEHASSMDTYHDVALSGKELDRDSLPYRYKFWENYYNRGMASYLPTRNSFSSTISTSILELYDSLGTHRHTIGVDGPEGTDELLGVGYYVTNQKEESLKEVQSYSNQSFDIWVYDVRRLPIGFTYRTYMTEEDFFALEADVRACAMLNSLVVSDEEAEQVGKVLARYDPVKDGRITLAKKETYIRERQKETITDFVYDSRTFSGTVTTEEEAYLFFSVPYDEQWEVVVNGSKEKILNINGLMAVKVNQGQNAVEFRYRPRYLELGITVSIAAFVLTLIWIKLPKRKRRV